MTQFMDQAPQQQPDNSNRAPHAGNPESMHPGSQRFFGGVPPHAYEGPHPIDRDPSNRTNRNIVIATTAIFGTVIAGAGIGFGVLRGSHEIAEEMAGPRGNDRVALAPVIPGEHTSRAEVDPAMLTVDQFYDDSVLSEAQRIEWADELITKRTTPELLAEINASLRGGNREPLGPLVPASPDNTGDEILTQQAVAGFIASKEADPNTGRKLIAGFATEDNPGFEGSKNQLGGGQNPVLATYRVARADTTQPSYETATFYQTPIGDYIPQGVPSKFMMTQNTFDGKFGEVTVKYEGGRWVTVDTIPVGDPDWVKLPRELPVR